MDFRLLQKIFGLLLIIFSFSMIPPVIVSFFDSYRGQMTFTQTFFIVLFIGLVLFTPVRDYEKGLKNREGFIVVTLFWVIFSGLGAIHLCFQMTFHYP